MEHAHNRPSRVHVHGRTTPPCQRVRGLSSLLLSEAELERKSLLLLPPLPPLLTLLSLSLPLSSRVYFANPPRLGSNPGFHATAATPYRVLNTNRDASFFASLFPEQDFLNAIITINEEEANGCIGPLPFSGLSLLSFRSSGEPLKEARPLVAFLSFRRFLPPLLFSSAFLFKVPRKRDERGGGGRSFAADRNARLFPPVSRCAARLYPRFTIFMPDSGQSEFQPSTATCR